MKPYIMDVKGFLIVWAIMVLFLALAVTTW